MSTEPIGVNPFLELIKEGLERGGAEFGVETFVNESADISQLEDNLRAAVEDGNDLIVANSFDSVDAMSYMRLLKLLYLAERKSLAETGRPILGDRTIAMQQGPVMEATGDTCPDCDRG